MTKLILVFIGFSIVLLSAKSLGTFWVSQGVPPEKAFICYFIAGMYSFLVIDASVDFLRNFRKPKP